MAVKKRRKSKARLVVALVVPAAAVTAVFLWRTPFLTWCVHAASSPEKLGGELARAVEEGDTIAVRCLLFLGAPETLTDDSETLLYAAAREAHAGVVRALLDHGTDLSMAEPALTLAAEDGSTDVVEALLDGIGGVESLRPAPLLVIAAARGHIALAELLVERQGRATRPSRYSAVMRIARRAIASLSRRP